MVDEFGDKRTEKQICYLQSSPLFIDDVYVSADLPIACNTSAS